MITPLVTSLPVAGVDLSVSEEMKVLGVTLDRRLTFDKHVSAVARAYNYHAQATRHVRPLLTTELAQTLACSLILSRMDYCNAVLHGAPTGTIQKLQRVQNNAARIGSFYRSQDVLTLNRCSNSCTGCQSCRESATKWLYWHTRLDRRQHQPIWINTSRHAASHAVCVRRPCCCCLNIIVKPLSPSVHSDALRQQFGTHFRRRSLTLTHYLFLNPDLKLCISP